VYVSFDAKKTFGKTTTIAELLKEKSSLVPELPAGEIYKSFNVWVGNGGVATPKNIENPEIGLNIEKSWLQDKSIDPASITLNMYSDKKWEQFPVNSAGEDSTNLYFTANVSGYSSFVITGNVKGTAENQKASEKQEASEQQKENLSGNGSAGLTNGLNNTTIKSGIQKSTPGFEMVFGIACLLSVFIYRRK
jgi:PGF-pre-PGF domain-containing protein